MVRPTNLDDARLRTTSQNSYSIGMNQNGRIHKNPIFDPELRGLGPTRRPYNEPFRRMKNVPQPQAPPMNAPLIGQQVRQLEVLAERNDIINLIHKIYGPTARVVQTLVYKKLYPEWIDRIEFLRGFKFSAFTLLSRDRS